MKIISLFTLILIIVVVFWFIKTNTTDVKARKEAVYIKVTIKKLHCKKRLKGDKSLVIVNYQGKSYPLSVSENDCYRYKLNETINAYYSKTYDKLFLNK